MLMMKLLFGNAVTNKPIIIYTYNPNKLILLWAVDATLIKLHSRHKYENYVLKVNFIEAKY